MIILNDKKSDNSYFKEETRDKKTLRAEEIQHMNHAQCTGEDDMPKIYPEDIPKTDEGDKLVRGALPRGAASAPSVPSGESGGPSACAPGEQTKAKPSPPLEKKQRPKMVEKVSSATEP